MNFFSETFMHKKREREKERSLSYPNDGFYLLPLLLVVVLLLIVLLVPHEIESERERSQDNVSRVSFAGLLTSSDRFLCAVCVATLLVVLLESSYIAL